MIRLTCVLERSFWLLWRNVLGIQDQKESLTHEVSGNNTGMRQAFGTQTFLGPTKAPFIGGYPPYI